VNAASGELQRVPVGIGELAVTGDPKRVLVAYGLGSCVAVAAYDPVPRIAGMLHVLLPGSGGERLPGGEEGRFADTGMDQLLQEMARAGAIKRRLVIKLAGGASVLGAANGARFKIGERNAEAIRERLRLHGLRASAEATGGTKGRTLELHAGTGKTFVRTVMEAASEL